VPMRVPFKPFVVDRDVTIAGAWAPLVDLRPVPCERRTVFALALSRSHQTDFLAVDRLSYIGTVPLDHHRIDDGLTLSEARKLAFFALSTGFRSTVRRLAARLRARFR